MSLLLIEQNGARRELALLEQGLLTEYRRDGASGGLQAEDIFLGKANRVMKALQAVFVRLSPDTEGFLPFDEIPSGRQPRPGESLLVQVKKPPTAGKAAYLSCDITLPGSLVLLLPFGRACHVSKRLTDEADRQRLLSLAREMAPAGMALVMREESLRASREAIGAELDGLLSRWREIEASARTAAAPCGLSQAPDTLSKLLRECRDKPEKLITNKPEGLPALDIPVQQAQNPFALYDVKGQLNKALRRKQLMKSGASLVIDPCEAMTVIDVNTAQSVEGKDKDKAILRTNMEAAESIARLLRLRRTGGIVMIDFIDMAAQADRDTLLAHLEDALRADPVKTVVHGFTRLGLVEMTRRRSQDALPAQTLRRCERCGGSGYLEEDSSET